MNGLYDTRLCGSNTSVIYRNTGMKSFVIYLNTCYFR